MEAAIKQAKEELGRIEFQIQNLSEMENWQIGRQLFQVTDLRLDALRMYRRTVELYLDTINRMYVEEFREIEKDEEE